ncbi:MAG: GNAT family N-acetyltransferase [Pseudomonadota bacterium]
MTVTLSTEGPGNRKPRRKFVVRSPADINRLLIYLVTRVRLPRIEVSVDAFPAPPAHRARANIVRLSETTGITLGGLLLGLTLMVGTAVLIWNNDRRIYSVGWWTFAAICAGVIGCIATLVWARFRLVFELCLLRYRSYRLSKAPGYSPPPVVETKSTQAQHDEDHGRISVLSEMSDRHIEQLHQLYLREWWSKDRSLYATHRVIRGSQVVIGMVNESDELVAFARVLTDYTFKALVFDVIVAESARNLGLGRQLMAAITGHERLRQVRHFELYCLPELAEFYVPHGFSADVGNVQLLRRVRPELNAESSGDSAQSGIPT